MFGKSMACGLSEIGERIELDDIQLEDNQDNEEKTEMANFIMD